MLAYAGQKLDSYTIFSDATQIFCGLHELDDPNQYMNSVEMMLPYAGQKADS